MEIKEVEDLPVCYNTKFAIKARSPNHVMEIIKDKDNPLFAFCWGAEFFYKKNNRLACALINTGYSAN